ncbi:MAG: CPBP family intramembrane metalloprotease [Bacteroidales bacterium]|nr:MAG: CPBP family intramembrane metalloprotease [Bacteroidales bacterium]
MTKSTEANYQSNSKKTISKFFHIPFIRIIIGTVIMGFIYFLFSVLIKSITGFIEPEATIGRPVRAIIALLALLFGYNLLFKYYERRKVMELSIIHLPKDGLLGLVVGALMVSVTISFFALMGYYQVLSNNLSISSLLAGLIVLTSLAAVEEVIFRGVIYRICEEWLGTNMALIISAVLFGLAHMPNDSANLVSIISAIFGGIMLCLAYSATKRLWLPIFLHTGWNFSQLFYGTNLSGLSEFSVYSGFKSKLQGPEWLVGGEFGIENSVVAIIIVVVVAITLYYIMVKSGKLVKPSFRKTDIAG